MLRTSVFLIMASIAGTAAAQTQGSNDPMAAAPVQYDRGPATQSAPGMDCGLDDNGRPLACPTNNGYTPDDDMVADNNHADDAPIFTPDYYAYQDYEYYPPYYAGVSVWPGYYWPGYAWGWGGWGLGWGYPGISIGFGWAGHGGWGHGGWNHGWGGHGYASRGWGGDHFHGPWRYDGNGHYADNHRDFGRNSGSYASRGFNNRGAASFAGNRGVGDARGFNRGVSGAQNSAFRSNAQVRGASFGASRGSLPSSSYYSSARGGNAQSLSRGNAVAGRSSVYASGVRANGYGGNSQVRAGNAMQNRGYANQSYRGASMNRGYAGNVQQRGGYSMQSRGGYGGSYGRSGYSGAGRSYSAARVSAPHMSSGGGHSSGGGGHSSGGGGHSGGGGGHHN